MRRPQLRELWWPNSSVQAADRRLLKLFRAGYVDRFRPISRRGSFPWTYQLGLEGHRLVQRAGFVGPRERFVRREVYDYGHVLHELQLNAWVLAYRRAAGDLFLSWEGETHSVRVLADLDSDKPALTQGAQPDALSRAAKMEEREECCPSRIGAVTA